MRSPYRHSAIPPSLTGLLLLEVLVLLIASLSLIILPRTGPAYWPWPLTPYNTAFLGAVYLAALVPIGLLPVVGRWVLARFVLWLQLVFSSPLLLTSLLYIDRFNLQRETVWAWFMIATALPLASLYFLWQSRRLGARRSRLQPLRWQVLLLGEGLCLGLYGLGLLLAPSLSSSFWPWSVDEFHARLYSAVFLTPALGSLLLLRSPIRSQWLTLGLMQALLGALPIWAILRVDASAQRIDWSTPQSWLWLGLFSALSLVGLGMLGHGRTMKAWHLFGGDR